MPCLLQGSRFQGKVRPEGDDTAYAAITACIAIAARNHRPTQVTYKASALGQTADHGTRAGQFDPETYPATIAALRSQNSLASPSSSA